MSGRDSKPRLSKNVFAAAAARQAAAGEGGSNGSGSGGTPRAAQHASAAHSPGAPAGLLILPNSGGVRRGSSNSPPGQRGLTGRGSPVSGAEGPPPEADPLLSEAAAELLREAQAGQWVSLGQLPPQKQGGGGGSPQAAAAPAPAAAGPSAPLPHSPPAAAAPVGGWDGETPAAVLATAVASMRGKPSRWGVQRAPQAEPPLALLPPLQPTQQPQQPAQQAGAAAAEAVAISPHAVGVSPHVAGGSGGKEEQRARRSEELVRSRSCPDDRWATAATLAAVMYVGSSESLATLLLLAAGCCGVSESLKCQAFELAPKAS